MAAMSFQERAFLTLYKRFYGVNYPAGSEDVTDLHVQSQKMCYVLKVKGLDIGEFDYSWNYHGPYSAGLQCQLKALDAKQDEVAAYYEASIDNKSLFSDEIESVFSSSDAVLIDRVVDQLEIKTHTSNPRDWVELLASIMFISRSIFPGESRDIVEGKLLELKPKYKEHKELAKAWNILSTAGLLVS